MRRRRAAIHQSVECPPAARSADAETEPPKRPPAAPAITHGRRLRPPSASSSHHLRRRRPPGVPSHRFLSRARVDFVERGIATGPVWPRPAGSPIQDSVIRSRSEDDRHRRRPTHERCRQSMRRPGWLPSCKRRRHEAGPPVMEPCTSQPGLTRCRRSQVRRHLVHAGDVIGIDRANSIPRSDLYHGGGFQPARRPAARCHRPPARLSPACAPRRDIRRTRWWLKFGASSDPCSGRAACLHISLAVRASPTLRHALRDEHAKIPL